MTKSDAKTLGPGDYWKLRALMLNIRVVQNEQRESALDHNRRAKAALEAATVQLRALGLDPDIEYALEDATLRAIPVVK